MPPSDQTRLAEWQQLADVPYAQFEGQGAAVNGKIYIFGGFVAGSLNVTTQAAVYDPANDTWTSITDAPIPLTHASHAVDGDKIYVLGGYVGDHPGGSTDQVWIYDTVNDTWTAGPSLPADRGGGGAAILDRKLYYFGGATRTQGDTSSATDQPHTWSLDLGATDNLGDDGNNWTRLADLPSPRNHMAGAALGPYVYAVGGQFQEDEFSGNSELVHRYDPTNDTWTRVADLPLAIGHISASTFTSNGRIFVVTGVAQNSTSTDTIFMYDPATDTWTALPPDAGAVLSRQSRSRSTAASMSLAAKRTTPASTDNTYMLDLTSPGSAWRPCRLRWVKSASGVIDDTLYLVGEGNDATLAYNLGTGQWSDVSDLAKRIFAGNHHAAEIIDGKLYCLVD